MMYSLQGSWSRRGGHCDNVEFLTGHHYTVVVHHHANARLKTQTVDVVLGFEGVGMSNMLNIYKIRIEVNQVHCRYMYCNQTTFLHTLLVQRIF